MQKVLVFGYGNWFKKWEKYIISKYSVLAIVDNNKEKQGFYNDVEICSEERVATFDYDLIIVTIAEGLMDIIRELSRLCNDKSKILPWLGYINLDDKAEVCVKESGIHIKLDVNDSRLSFLLRHNTDVVVFREIFQRKIYRINMPFDHISFVDIGMNVGLASLFFASIESTDRVYGFEPFNSTYLQALSNISDNDYAVANKIRTYKYALSDYEGEQDFIYYPDEPGNCSIVNSKYIDNVNKQWDKERICVRKASDVLGEIFDIDDNRIVVKCDCEGSEYNIFQNLLSEGLLRKPYAYIVETHLSRGEELADLLSGNGYNVIFLGEECNPLGLLYAIKEGD